MSRRVVLIEPEGWPCMLAECPPGFFMFQDSLGLKTEYRDEQGTIEPYCESGEVFWGGTSTVEARGNLIVQPAVVRITDEEGI